MAQFLLLTTLFTIGALVATSIAGFVATPVHAARHIFFALVTVVVGLFSQSMTMFFFIGTGKEIKEKVKGAKEEPIVVQQTKSFKSRVFPAAMWAIAALMVLFITGGGVPTGKTPRLVHDALVLVTLFTFLRAYWIQLHAMTENARLMEKYLAE